MAEKDVKSESAAEEAAVRLSEKKVYDIKGGVKDKARPALLNAVLLAVTVLAAASNFLANIDGDEAANMGLPIFLGVVTLLCWLGLTLYSVLKRDRVQSKIMAVISGISFVGFFAFLITGFGGTNTELVVLVFGALSLPYFAVYAFLEALGLSTGGIMFTVVIIYIALIAVNVWNFIRLRVLSGMSEPDGAKTGFKLRMFEDGGRRDDNKDK